MAPLPSLMAVLLASCKSSEPSQSVVSRPDTGADTDAVAVVEASAPEAAMVATEPCDPTAPVVGDRWTYALRVDVPAPNDAYQAEAPRDQVLTLRNVSGAAVTVVDVTWGADRLASCDVSACGLAFGRAPFPATSNERIARDLSRLQEHFPSVRVLVVG